MESIRKLKNWFEKQKEKEPSRMRALVFLSLSIAFLNYAKIEKIGAQMQYGYNGVATGQTFVFPLLISAILVALSFITLVVDSIIPSRRS